MSNSENPRVGTVGWQDLTVANAEQVRDFYQDVVGWKSEPVDMGGYNDFNMMIPGSEDPAAGICHARGGNAGLPAQWILYFIVGDIDQSMDRCKTSGGEVLVGPKKMGESRYCVIRDPAGAVCALFQP